MRIRAACLLVLPALSLAGCAGLADVAPEAAGLGAGAGAGVLTANPLIGVAVGLGVRLATDEAIGLVESSHQRALQQAIAEAAGEAPVPDAPPDAPAGEPPAGEAPVGEAPVGEAPVGAWVRWSSRPSAVNDLLFGTASGSVQVTRAFGGRIRCREILYSVDGEGGIVGLVDDASADAEATAVATVGNAAHAPSEEGGGAADPRVRVAVICRAGPAGRWRWAVSEPVSQR